MNARALLNAMRPSADFSAWNREDVLAAIIFEMRYYQRHKAVPPQESDN